MSETKLVEAEVKVDFPQTGEVVTSPSYAIRIGIPDAVKVELAINNGSWQPCRFSVGYWWYDWSGYLPGKHQLATQTHTKDGRTLTSRPRQVTVKLDRKPAL